MRKIPFIAVAACAVAFSAPAHAAFVVDLLESGSDVVATGAGTIDLTDLIFLAGGVSPSSILSPLGGAVAYGASSSASLYGTLAGPTNFGPGAGVAPTSATGDSVGEFFGGSRLLEVPQGYLSGAALSNTATFANQTFASLGATPGTYVWTWGQGAHADSFTLNVGATTGGGVPEPSTWALAVVACGLAGVTLRRARQLA